MSCTFLPPYLVGRLAALEADRRLSVRGARTLRLDDALRARRDATPETASPRPPQPGAAPPETSAPDLPAAAQVQPLTPGTPANPRSDGTHRGSTHPALVVHDARQLEVLPGPVVRTDPGAPSGDPAVDEAYQAAAAVWRLFAEQFGWESYDGHRTPLSVTVHYGRHYDNAFWDGRQLVLGDGDALLFRRFTAAPEVLAHEFAHGVTQCTARLSYQGQPGALNESVSDVVAVLSRQHDLGHTAGQADWLIGAGLFRAGVRARALRDLLHPGTAYDDPRLGHDRQVAAMADYLDTDEDSGGVHINSGIPNRAFALASLGVGGQPWRSTGQVWFDALTSGAVQPQTGFADFARATVSSARRRFPADPRVAEQVQAAWVQVGVLRPAPSTQASTATAPPPSRSGAHVVAVRRTGGFAGIARVGELDLDADPAGSEVRELLGLVDFTAAAGSASADRFSYQVSFGEQQLELGEQDLSPELQQVVRIVLGQRDPGRELT